MSTLASVLEAWPAMLAGAIAALVPREAKLKHRLGFGLVALLTVAFVLWLWPSGEPPTGHGAEWPQLLNVLVGLPLCGAAVVLFVPRQMLRLLRGLTYGIFALGFVCSLWLVATPMTVGWHFQFIKDWIPSAGIRYHVAVDGMSVWLVLLTTFTTPIAAFSSFGSVKTRIKELCIAFLVLQAAMIGAFVALDLFLFYLFWELMLVPMFLLIGIWGGPQRIYAAVKFFIFTMTGSMLMLAAMLYLVWTNHALTGSWSFDYLELCRVVLPAEQSATGISGPMMWCFWAFSIAFFIKVPMFPLHTWLPDAHVEAPTGGSVVLAAVMLKLGTYSYLRFSMGLFPLAASHYSATLAGMAIMGGILYGALVAWKQKDFKRLIAYSSVAHLGFVMLGLFGATPSGIQGAILQMVNHGISTGALFLLVGVIYDRRHTRELSEFGGLAKIMPVYAAVFVVVTLGSIGVPGTNGFVGEFLIIAATYLSPRLSAFGSLQAVGAALGVILAAIYMLGVVQQVFFGPLRHAKNRNLPDLTPREGLSLAPLVLLVFAIGLFPSVLLEPMKPSVEAYVEQFNFIAGQGASASGAQRLEASAFFRGFLKGSPSGEGPPPAAQAEGAPAEPPTAAPAAATAPPAPTRADLGPRPPDGAAVGADQSPNPPARGGTDPAERRRPRPAVPAGGAP
jgi:NADH-quinone oxidoreductase subunit M